MKTRKEIIDAANTVKRLLLTGETEGQEFTDAAFLLSGYASGLAQMEYMRGLEFALSRVDPATAERIREVAQLE